MKIQVKLIATYRDHLPPGTSGNTTSVDVRPGSSVRDVLAPFGIPLDGSTVIALNGVTVPLETTVSEGDRVAAFSAIGGG
ncbi:MAG: MoaD/ThiS family protein [Deltaproteobacteria bacterium]|nr:MoaD/ThiS family protein [Deltaproteobacteria bacterium]MBW2541228.1 MoaD/ThiS family protein [Deltaproteobacteria bacterium]